MIERSRCAASATVEKPSKMNLSDPINRIFSLISQLNQSINELYLARSCCCSQSSVAQSRPFVTDKSVLRSVLKSWSLWDFKLSSNFIKTNQIMEWKNEKNKIYKN